MIKLDLFDKKILEVLLANSRVQVTGIAKKIRLRRENVNYRINRLMKLGLIREFNTIFNERKLGLHHYVVFLELVKLKQGSEQKILDYLSEHRFMTWVGTSAGKWSLVFDVIVPENIQLDKILNDLLATFGEFMGDYVVLKLLSGDYLLSKLFGDTKHKRFHNGKFSAPNLDKNDFEILSSLNKNSRESLVAISKIVSLTPNGINNRIKNLEKNGIISGYSISIDWKKLGYELYDIQLKLIRFGEEIDNKLINYFYERKSIVFYYRYLGGRWDYDIGLVVKNSNELREFINEFRKFFSDIAKISDVFITLEEITGNKLPKGTLIR